MRIAVLADTEQKKELKEKGFLHPVAVAWVQSADELLASGADAYFDLLFERTDSRVECLTRLLPGPVIINAVTDTLTEIGQPFIRVNAWPGFIGRPITEIAVAYTGQQQTAEWIFSQLGWPFILVPDQPGMIAPRVVAMIVNEAYFALNEQVSTKTEIDTAMKLGTHYPYGPFEWSKKIGLEKIHALLAQLHKMDGRYQAAAALVSELQSAGSL